MDMRIRFVLLVLTYLLAGASLNSQASSHTFIGIVREDGGLVPIAIYDGSDWWNRWPWSGEGGSVGEVPVPATLDAVPADWLPPGVRLPREWTMHRLEGGRRTIRIHDQPSYVAGVTMETIVLWSNYPFKPKASDSSDGSGDAGVAIAGRGRIATFVTTSTSESRRILAPLRQRLGELEQKAIQEWQTERAQSAGSNSTPATLVRTYRGERTDPFTLVKARRRIGGRTYYFLDGETLYVVGGDARYDGNCKLNVSFGGVVVAQSGRRLSEKIAASPYAEFCGDRPDWATPLASLELDDKVLWVLRVSVEDGYDYALFDPDANDFIILKDEWGLRSNR